MILLRRSDTMEHFAPGESGMEWLVFNKMWAANQMDVKRNIKLVSLSRWTFSQNAFVYVRKKKRDERRCLNQHSSKISALEGEKISNFWTWGQLMALVLRKGCPQSWRKQQKNHATPSCTLWSFPPSNYTVSAFWFSLNPFRQFPVLMRGKIARISPLINSQ